MINVTEIYENTDKNKKSPGQWLNSKDVKSIVSELDAKTDKNDDGVWFFDELLSKHYDLYLNPLKIKQTQSEDTKPLTLQEDLNETYIFTRNAFLEFVTGKSISHLTRYAELEEIFNGLPEYLKLQFKAFAYSFKIQFETHKKREERQMKYTLNTLLSTMRINIDPEEVLFKNDNITIRYKRTTK